METILFTDIEGSTRLWEEQRDAMAAALVRHDGIVSTGIGTAGGHVLKTTGDGFIAIFEAPQNAVVAALGIQQSLASEQWGTTGPIRVRIGIHAGETEYRDNDYFGPAMNRTARIMAAGHGGQILLSSAVASLVEHALPPGSGLRDLGAHRLKDLTRPEHLFQLVAGGLPTEFPPLRTLDARPGNLPLQPTEFLGRARELAAIETTLQLPGTRLLTITGPAGTGKTRLALQAAADVLEAFRDGVFFVDLSAERMPDAAFEAVVRTLDLPIAGNGSALETLKVRLRDKQLLLVLDNFEQVIDAAPGIADLIQHLPDVKALVTSRESLRIQAERIYPVPPLSLPASGATVDAVMASEAVRLFEERGRAVRPDFAVTPENARAIAAICERLDGLPLAIELAAARLRLFAPAELLVRLEGRLDVLGAGSRDLPERQRTLRGAIGWSYELLAPDERTLFEALSVFASADLAAIESVVSGTNASLSVLEALESLVDKSLVLSRVDGGVQRFFTLRMVQDYATERLTEAAGGADAVRVAHARYFSGLADQLAGELHGDRQDAALSRLEPELGNLRTAWQYWLDAGDLDQLFGMIDGLWSLHAARGWYHAAIELLNGMLAALAKSGRGPEFAAEELALRANLARALMAVGGYNVEVERALNRALELAEAGGMTRQEFPVLRALASIYNQRTSWDAALAIGRHLISLGEREQDRTMLAEGHYVIGVNTLFTDPTGAIAELDEAIALFGPAAQTGERLRLGPNSAVLARTASSLMLWMAGALDRSVERMGEALQIARRIEHPYTLAYALYHCGFLAINRYRFDECLEYAHELRTVAETHGYPIWATLARLLEGVGVSALGQPADGLAMAETAVDLYQGLTPPPAFWVFILMLRASVHAMAGQVERALELLEEASAAVGSLAVDPPALRVLKGDIMRLLPDPPFDLIQANYTKAIEIGEAAGLYLGALTGAAGLVVLRRQFGRSPDGSDKLAAILREFKEGRDEHDVVAARELLSEGRGCRDSSRRLHTTP